MIDYFERQATTHSTIGTTAQTVEALKRIYSTKSDVWSWANKVVEILTGREPFPHLELLEIVTRFQGEWMHPEVPANAPKWPRELLIRCWSPDPQDRPTIAEVVDVVDANGNEETTK